MRVNVRAPQIAGERRNSAFHSPNDERNIVCYEFIASFAGILAANPDLDESKANFALSRIEFSSSRAAMIVACN